MQASGKDDQIETKKSSHLDDGRRNLSLPSHVFLNRFLSSSACPLLNPISEIPFSFTQCLLAVYFAFTQIPPFAPVLVFHFTTFYLPSGFVVELPTYLLFLGESGRPPRLFTSLLRHKFQASPIKIVSEGETKDEHTGPNYLLSFLFYLEILDGDMAG
jgi:hypothetical protein